MTVDAAEVVVLRPEPGAPLRARRFVQAALLDRVRPDVCDTAVLLASELVTNAVLHGRSPLSVEVSAGPGVVRVAVGDENSRLPVARPGVPGALDGRGLLIVGALASAWGVEVRPLGKAVWFELPA